MLSGRDFKEIRSREYGFSTVRQPKSEAFLNLVSDVVAERFTRMTALRVLVIPIDLAALEVAEDRPLNVDHLACAAFAHTDYCRECWQLHLAELKRRPRTHWHRCDYCRLCAIVPLVFEERCLAAVKLVCPDSMGRDAFERNVELLDTLVDNLVGTNSEFLASVVRPEKAIDELITASSDNRNMPANEERNNEHVLKALQFIRDHLSEPSLSVQRIARELRVHPDYLSNLFSVEVGQRMAKYITTKRMELAKTLLTTTEWQVKRIAYETGYTYPSWFTHAFRAHSAVTPSEYRRKARCDLTFPRG